MKFAVEKLMHLLHAIVPLNKFQNLTLPVAAIIGFYLVLAWLFSLALEEVLVPARSLVRQFWISFGGTACLAVAALVVNRCRRFCARLADVEDALSMRIHRKASLRSFESRACRIGVWILFALYSTVTAIIGLTCLYFRETGSL
jgi:hypothetical protein